MDRQLILELKEEKAQSLAEGADLSVLLAGSLAQDAIALGARRIRVDTRQRPWVLVGADRDWISSATRSAAQAFEQMLLWPGTSKYFRSESRVAAYASAIFIWQDAAMHRLCGEQPPQLVCEAAGKHAFAVGFSCE